MKSLKIPLFVFAFIFSTGAATTVSAQPGYHAHVNFETFYTELSPHGRWVDMPRYGKVWVYRERNFRPYYTRGHWVNTPLGWSWASDYRWGWAPFHYGRWEHDARIGWFWIPGYEYAPAWVAWSQVDDHYGWAPLGFGVDINVAFTRIPAQHWVYMPGRHMAHNRIDRYAFPYERNRVYYQRQRPVVNVHVHNNVRYQRGPVADPNRVGSRPVRSTREAGNARQYAPAAARNNGYPRTDNNGTIRENNIIERQNTPLPPRTTVRNRQSANASGNTAVPPTNDIIKKAPSQSQNDILKRQRAIKAEVSRQ